jgi:hypothetical protein
VDKVVRFLRRGVFDGFKDTLVEVHNMKTT